MPSMKQKIIEYAETLPEGAPLIARGLLHLGSRGALDNALSTLAREGNLIKAMRGVYFLPVASQYGVRSPSVGKIVEGLAASLGETIVSNGAVAANGLGLSTQIPVRHVFLTSGRSRRMRLGKQEVEFRHAETWQLAHGRQGQALRALEWLGERETPRAMEKLKETLTAAEIGNIAMAAVNLPQTVALGVREALNG